MDKFDTSNQENQIVEKGPNKGSQLHPLFNEAFAAVTLD